MNYRTPSRVVTLLALFSMLAQLCVGMTTGAATRAKNTPAAEHHGKVSKGLRDRLSRRGGSAQKTPTTETAEVILQLNGKPTGRLNALLNRAGVRVRAKLERLDTFALELPLEIIEELSSLGEVDFVSPDENVVSTGHVVTTTGAEAVRNAGLVSGLLGQTLDGSGVGIAIIDSGIDVSHKAFAATLNPGGRIKVKKDFTGDNKSDKDFYGHGTHVASSAAGVSTVAGGTYEGLAKGADIINLRVLDSQGRGRVSDLLNALNWILSPVDPNKVLSASNPTNATKYNIRVVNLSLGAPAVDSYRVDPLCKAVRRLVDAGIVVVAAAGNNGKDASGQKLYGAIHSPGDEPSAITVGATNTFGTDARGDDGIATYSSRGPTRGSWVDEAGARHYDNLIKPDLSAPGNRLIYAEADDGGNPNTIVRQNPRLDTGLTDTDNKRLMYLSGTSMAAPLVAGAAALMLQANPKLTPNMVKMILMYTAQPLPGFNTLEQGSGQLNVEGAVRLARLVRTDLTPSTPLGSPLLTGAQPSPSTTIAGQTFPWAQGLVLNYGYATGNELISKYQKVYGTGILLSDGMLVNDGILLSDSTMWTSSIGFGDSVNLSNGSPLFGGERLFGQGRLFGDGHLMSDGHLLGDAILMSDGHLLGDAILMSDSIVFGDGILMSDSILFGDSIFGDANLQAQSAQVDGDNTTFMQ
jgi:serine protease AprX